MRNSYLNIPKTISFSAVTENKFALSASQYRTMIIPNSNCLLMRDFLDRPLRNCDLGSEIGSINYIRKSPKYFLRTKALQEHSLLLEITKESALPIMPLSFVKMDLKEGDLLISKDSNIGEIAILDKDYPDYMLSGAIYKLPVTDKKYYLLAVIKHKIFREQLDIMTPKGVTIRHAKTMFLDCKIPMPNHNSENTIKFVELLTQAIINKEKLIKQRHETILQTIENELKNNQKGNVFSSPLLTYKELIGIGRLDTSMYSYDFKKLDFLISNYTNGVEKLKNLKYKALRGPNLAVSVIGATHYTDNLLSNKFYKLIQPVDLSDFGTISHERYFGNSNNIQLLKEGDILFSAEGTIGKIHIIIDLQERAVTNYHGMSITNRMAKLYEKCFVGCFLSWLRQKKYFDFYSVGAQGGSFGKEKTENIKIPNFPETKQKEIAKLYHNPESVYDTKDFTLENFLEKDNAFNETAGIYELDKSAKQLKKVLNKAIDDIVNDREVKIDFKFM